MENKNELLEEQQKKLDEYELEQPKNKNGKQGEALYDHKERITERDLKLKTIRKG
jgi:hypothetical protein